MRLRPLLLAVEAAAPRKPFICQRGRRTRFAAARTARTAPPRYMASSEQSCTKTAPCEAATSSSSPGNNGRSTSAGGRFMPSWSRAAPPSPTVMVNFPGVEPVDTSDVSAEVSPLIRAAARPVHARMTSTRSDFTVEVLRSKARKAAFGWGRIGDARLVGAKERDDGGRMVCRRGRRTGRSFVWELHSGGSSHCRSAQRGTSTAGQESPAGVFLHVH